MGVCEAFNRERSVCTRRVWEGTYIYDTRESFLRPTEPPKPDVVYEDGGGVDALTVLGLIFAFAVACFVGLYFYVKRKAEKEEYQKRMREVAENWGDGRRDSLNSMASG